MEITVSSALSKGEDAYKNGDFRQANNYYSAILKVHPHHPVANHCLGRLAVDLGSIEKAAEFFKVALDNDQTNIQYLSSYIEVLIRLNRPNDVKLAVAEAEKNGAGGMLFEQIQKEFDDLNKKEIGNSRITDAKAGVSNELPSSLMRSVLLLHTEGDPEMTLSKARTLQSSFPESSFLCNIIGSALATLGRIEEAIETFNRAITINPKFAEAHNNLGNALLIQGDSGGAESALQNALALHPEFAEAHNNLGTLLKGQGKLSQAELSFKRALAARPDLPEAYNNLGTIFRAQGRLEEALEAFNQALAIRPDFDEALYNLSPILERLTYKESNIRIQDLILLILDRGTIARPSNLASTSIRLLKLNQHLEKHVYPNAFKNLNVSLLEIIRDLSRSPLFMKLMRICPLNDPDIEVLLTNVRAKLLRSLESINENDEILNFQSALALQCFSNEYIYSVTEEESTLLETLERRICREISRGIQPDAKSVLCFASYDALHRRDWCDCLIEKPALKQVILRQAIEPNKETQLKSVIIRDTEIENKVSDEVRKQYEQNPYPRWMNLRLALKPRPVDAIIEMLGIQPPDPSYREIRRPYILIAGCGTGQHCIETAALFKESKIFAIDLSLSSLAYAARKAEELGIKNIEFRQLDILNLPEIDQKFDIVESVGVLHHMENPTAGWRALTDSLRQGGLMKIGLYSDIARQPISALREEISNLSLNSTPEDMRTLRAKILRADDSDSAKIRAMQDFYSMSEFRDLLLHVQEHRFTIPKIKRNLIELGLSFCGFERSNSVTRFSLSDSGQDDLYDLDTWHAYEKENPMTFLGMYQFWCQKT